MEGPDPLPAAALAGQVMAGVRDLEARGYRVRLGRHLHAEWMGLAGTWEAHAEEFEEFCVIPTFAW